MVHEMKKTSLRYHIAGVVALAAGLWVVTGGLPASAAAGNVVSVASPAAAGSAPAPARQLSEIERAAAAITSRIALPDIPQDRLFNVVDYGAVSADRRDDRPAFRLAIAAASQAGGGVVIVPAGHYYIAGPLQLASHIELRLEKGACIEFSNRPQDYEHDIVLTRFESTEVYNYSPLIYAYGCEDVAITSTGGEREGIIDGNGSAWWPWVGAGAWKGCSPNQQAASEELKDMGNSDVPVKDRVFGRGKYLRPVLMQPYACKRVLIKGVCIKDSPMWNVAPVLSEDVTIDNVDITADGPNTDGVDPDACSNVWIKNSRFTTGDDCIAIKSGRDDDGRRVGVASSNIVIENNVFRDGHGGVTCGSEMAGGIDHVYSLNNVMDSPNLRWAYRLKTNSLRGGGVTDFYAYGDRIERVERDVLTVDMGYAGGDIGSYTPDIHGIHMENLQVKLHHAPLATVETYERNPVYDFTWRNCQLKGAGSHLFRLENTPPENITVSSMNIDDQLHDGHGNM